APCMNRRKNRFTFPNRSCSRSTRGAHLRNCSFKKSRKRRRHRKNGRRNLATATGASRYNRQKFSHSPRPSCSEGGEGGDLLRPGDGCIKMRPSPKRQTLFWKFAEVAAS